MEKTTITTINPTVNEVYVKIDKQRDDGVELVIYKDSRFDVNALNTLHGPLGWDLNVGLEQSALANDPKVYAEIKVYDPETNHWVCRKDYGEDMAGSIKALASDAVKRAAFRFGIGAALYTGPKKIFVPNERINLRPGTDGGQKCFDTFVVDEITYSDDGKRICTLTISDEQTNQVVFHWEAEQEDKKREERLKKFHDAKSSTTAAATTSPARKTTTKRTTTATPSPKKEGVSIPTVVSSDPVTPVTAKPEVKTAAPIPATTLAMPPLNGPKEALATIADAGNKKGEPLSSHRPVELAFLFGADSSDEVKNAIKQIAAATPSVKAACIKRGYGDIVA